MALHVTQCPNCESTFNTSAATLKLADGKVRCGSCLTVFHAIDNFFEPVTTNEVAEESVFVGNSPEDYFDPTVFLTRSALQEPDEPEAKIATPTAEPEELVSDQADSRITEDPPIVEESLELSEAYTKEFFEAIEQTMEESLKEAESEKDALMQELQETGTSFFEDFQSPLISESENR